MFRWIIGSSLQFRFLMLAMAAALVILGAMKVSRMPVDVFPEFAAPVVEVQTEALGLSPSEVESLVTLNLEELLSGVPWLKSIRSKSVTGLSSIVMTFEPGTDILRARQMIQERLTLAYTLPNVSHPPVILQPLSATSRFMMIAISSTKIEPTELSLLARWTIKPKLIGVPGVANVAIWGQKLRQMHVQFDPDRLRDARLMQEDIIAAAGDSLWMSPLTFLRGSAPGTGGWIDNRNQRLGVHHAMPIAVPEDMAKVPIGAQHLIMTGKSMALGDVAEVTFSHPPLIGEAVLKGGKGLLLVIEKFPSANTLEVTRGVEQALGELKLGLPGVDVDASVFRLASYIEDSISNLVLALIIGALLVIMVIGVFVSNWRSALVSVLSIAVSLVFALLVINLTGASMNTMIVAGLILALGVIIDDAMLDVQGVMARLRERKDGIGITVSALIRESVLETRRVMIYATLIVVLAVTPIFFMGGVSEAFFGPLALAYVLAVVASMLVALTITPVLSLVFLHNASSTAGESRVVAWLARRYEVALTKTSAVPRNVFVATAIVAIIGFGIVPFLGQSLLPSLKERELLVNWSTAPGTSYEETYRITSRVSEELRALPGIKNVGAHLGRAITGDQIVGINSGQIWVSIDPEADYKKTVGAIRETVDGYPGVDRNVQTYLRDRVNEVLTGSTLPIVVRIYGPKREVLRDKAEEVRKALSSIPGIVDLQAEGQLEEAQVKVQVSLDAAGRANIKPGDVRRISSTVFSGLTVGYLFEEQKINDVVVWGSPEARQSLTSLRDLWVGKSDRHMVRLSDVAEVSIAPTPTVLRHEALAAYVDVAANVVERDLGAVAKEVNERLQRIEFPLEHSPKLLGEYSERVEAQRRMLGITVAVVIGIFLLLQACFGSWRLASIGFLALPASIVGGLIAAFVSGSGISLGSIVGLLAVLGVAARSSLLLINHYQILREQQGLSFGSDLVVRGARERLPATIASSVAIIAAMLPIVVLGQRPGLEILQPIAIVIIGGLIASILVTLFVIPALYQVFGASARRQTDLGLTDAA